jgi:hypothetical protein
MRLPQTRVIFSGEDVVMPVAVEDNDAAVVDLSGGTARFVAARRVGGELVLDSDASPATATVTIPSPSNGIIEVALAGADTDALVGTYYWELKLTDFSSNETVVAYGYLDVKDNLS